MASLGKGKLASIFDPPLDPSLVSNTPRLLEALNKADRLQKLLNKRDGRGYTLLHIAAEKNQPESLKCLLIKEGWCWLSYLLIFQLAEQLKGLILVFVINVFFIQFQCTRTHTHS